MRFGLNTFLYASPFTNDSTKLFKKLKGWGFDTAEIPIEDPSHIDAAYVRAQADKAGLAIGTVCGCFGPGRDLRGSEEDQEASLAYQRAIIDQAAILGAHSVVGPLYSVVGLTGAHEDAERKQQFDLVVKNLKKLAPYAAEKGITLCVEPLNRFETDFCNTVEQGIKICKAVGHPSVKLLIDTFHMNIEEKSQPESIRKAGAAGLIGAFHACGTDRGAPGNDSLQWKPIVQALKEVGYDKDVVIESFTTDVKVIAKAAAIWRKMEPKRDDIAVKGLENLHRFFGRKAPKVKPALGAAAPVLEKMTAAKPTAKAAKKAIQL